MTTNKHTDEQGIQRITKICLEELNEAYKICKLEAEKVNTSRYTVIMGRDPLIINNLFTKIYKISDEEIDLVLKLQFEFDYNLGRKGAWYCTTELNIIDLD